MINLFNVNIDTISFHKIGNKSRVEGAFLTKQPVKLNDEITPLLKGYFFKPFIDASERYFHFTNDVHLEYNEMYKMVGQIFENPLELHEMSKKIASHLYDQANYPHIKSGEVAVMYLTNVSIDNEVVDAIGIFKSEMKQDFLQFEQKPLDEILELIFQQGINLTKIDKGCLIFNKKAAEGYKILTIDTNKYDSRYWLEHFLGVEVFQDEHFITRRYLKFTQDFAKDVVLPVEDKMQEVLFNNKSLDFFRKNDVFEEKAFINEVIDNPDLISEFNNYKADKCLKYNIDGIDKFQISPTVVTEVGQRYSAVINLDTNISIHMDFVNPESAEKFVEKGWDDEKQMYYYLVYFNKEQKK